MAVQPVAMPASSMPPLSHQAKSVRRSFLSPSNSQIARAISGGMAVAMASFCRAFQTRGKLNTSDTLSSQNGLMAGSTSAKGPFRQLRSRPR